MDTEVLVVGAGPAGLALACGLRQFGVPVRVVDKAAGPATTSRANFVHARGSEVLDRLGALGDLPAESVRAMAITTYAGDRPMMRLRFGDPGLKTAAPPMVVSQARVEAALRTRLAELGVEPEWGLRLVGAQQDASGVSAVFGDGRTIRVGWLVGCDGTGSTVRKAAGIGFRGVKVSERFLLVDAQIDTTLDRTGTTGWLHAKGSVGAMPMPGKDMWRLLVYDPDFRDEKPSEQRIADRVRQILPERTGRTDMDTWQEVGWASLFSVHRRLADRYRQGRVLLAGDAAHVHAPFGGQGMLTGLGDAENLAWKLALVIQGRADDELLDTYEAERRPLAAQVLRGSTAATKVNIVGNAFGRFIRDHVLMPVFNLPWIQRWTTYTASQLWVSYARGPLGGRGAKPRQGERIADLPCVGADGTTTRLHEQLRGHWAMVNGSAECVAIARRRLGPDVVILTADAPQPILVRPDGHLACHGEPAKMKRWLGHALRTELRTEP